VHNGRGNATVGLPRNALCFPFQSVQFCNILLFMYQQRTHKVLFYLKIIAKSRYSQHSCLTALYFPFWSMQFSNIYILCTDKNPYNPLKSKDLRTFLIWKSFVKLRRSYDWYFYSMPIVGLSSTALYFPFWSMQFSNIYILCTDKNPYNPLKSKDLRTFLIWKSFVKLRRSYDWYFYSMPIVGLPPYYILCTSKEPIPSI